MVPGIGGGELVVIAVVALIVVGPKDLPKMLRQLGRFVGKMRSMADEFRSSFEDMARQSELDELRKEVDALRAGKAISPVLEDVTTQMHAIGSDINSAIRPTPDYTAPSDTPVVDADPQMMGQPPQAEIMPPQAEIMPPQAELAEPVVKVKKPRAPKAAKVEAVTEPVPETLTEPAAKPKRAPRKKPAETKADA